MNGAAEGRGELPLAECRLDLAGLREQRERYRLLGEHVERVARRPRVLVVGFDAAVAEALVEETIAVERSCCEFFELGYDRGRRELAVAVADPRQDPALDAIAHALGATGARGA